MKNWQVVFKDKGMYLLSQEPLYLDFTAPQCDSGGMCVRPCCMLATCWGKKAETREVESFNFYTGG